MGQREDIGANNDAVSRPAPECSESALELPVVCTGGTIACRPSKHLAASIDPKNKDPRPGAVSGFNMAETRAVVGVISLMSSNHLPPMAGSRFVKPVILPPGR